MAQTTLMAPDGNPITIEHPEGASLSQISQQAQIGFRQRQAKEAERQGRLETLKKSNPGEYDPSSDEFKAKYGPVGGNTENFFAGIGKAGSDLLLGAKQLGVEGANLIPGVDLDEQAGSLRAEAGRRRERDAPLLDTKAGLGGFIGGNVATALLPGGIAGKGTSAVAKGLSAFTNPQTFKAAAGAGGLLGALNPVGEGESRTANVALGGAAGAAGKAIAQPLINQLSKAGNAAKTLLQKEGIPLNLAQKTGSSRAATTGRLLDDSILTSNKQAAFQEKQARAFTRAVLRKIGADSDEATEQVMVKASDDIGKLFDDAADGVNIRMDDGLGQDLLDIYAKAQDNLTDDSLRLFERNWVKVFNNAKEAGGDNILSGARFKALRGEFSALSRNSSIGPQARQVERALMESLKKASPGKADVLDEAIGMWRNLKILQGTVGKGASRFISPQKLSNAITTKTNQNLSVFGRGKPINKALADLARAGRELLPGAPASPTARATQLATIGELGGATAGGFALGGPVGAGAGFLGGLLTPKVLQSGFNSQGLLGALIEKGLPKAVQPAVKQGAIQGGLLVQ